MNIICMLNTDTLYDKANSESVPFFKVRQLSIIKFNIVAHLAGVNYKQGGFKQNYKR
jgi:hypothetical protein